MRLPKIGGRGLNFSCEGSLARSVRITARLCKRTDGGTVGGVVRKNSAIVFLAIHLLILGFALLGAAPKQSERPPQPFFQDFFSGTVLLQGAPPPEGTLLIACIDDCEDGFQSVPYQLKADGSFDQLEVAPEDEDMVGHLITFYLVNDFGRNQAVETRPYIGVFDFYRQDLTFVDPMPLPEPTPRPKPAEAEPAPTPTASLPIAGEPVMARLPVLVLILGLVMAVLGGGLLMLSKRGAR